MKCPRDHAILQRAKIAEGTLVFACPECDGRVVAMPVLRRQLTDEAMRGLWQRARTAPPPTVDGTLCPVCTMPMAELALPEELGDRRIDYCRPCQLVWCDAHEHEAMPQRPPPPPPPEHALPPEVRQRRAIDQVEKRMRLVREQNVERTDFSVGSVSALLGLPVELDASPLPTYPWATWITAAVLSGFSVAGLAWPEVMEAMWLVPEYAGSTYPLVTVFLVHAGWLHLLSNLWFLLTFGDDVEVRLGRARWFGLVFGATLAGSVLHVLLDPSSSKPCVGASGGISGLIACYAMLLPEARLGTWVSSRGRLFWITFSARSGLVLWILLQAWLMLKQVYGGNVSAAAHLGGAVVGLLAWATWRPRDGAA